MTKTNQRVATITERSFDAEGVMVGDKVSYQEEKLSDIKSGTKVVAEVDKNKKGVYLYDPPYLTAQTFTGMSLIRVKTSKVLGIAMSLKRDL